MPPQTFIILFALAITIHHEKQGIHMCVYTRGHICLLSSSLLVSGSKTKKYFSFNIFYLHFIIIYIISFFIIFSISNCCSRMHTNNANK